MSVKKQIFRRNLYKSKYKYKKCWEKFNNLLTKKKIPVILTTVRGFDC